MTSAFQMIIYIVALRNTDCDYSSAYVTIYTDSELVGHGMTFTIGRGNDIVSLFSRESTVRYISILATSSGRCSTYCYSAFWECVTDDCLFCIIGVPCNPRGCWTLSRKGSREPFSEYGQNLGLDVF